MANDTPTNESSSGVSWQKLSPTHQEELATLHGEKEAFISRANDLGYEDTAEKLWEDFKKPIEEGVFQPQTGTPSSAPETQGPTNTGTLAGAIKDWDKQQQAKQAKIREASYELVQEDEERIALLTSIDLDKLEEAQSKSKKGVKTFKDSEEYRAYMKDVYTRAYHKVPPRLMAQMARSGELQKRVAGEKRQMQAEFLLKHYDTYDKSQVLASQYKLTYLPQKEITDKNKTIFEKAEKKIAEEQLQASKNKPTPKKPNILRRGFNRIATSMQKRPRSNSLTTPNPASAVTNKMSGQALNPQVAEAYLNKPAYKRRFQEVQARYSGRQRVWLYDIEHQLAQALSEINSYLQRAAASGINRVLQAPNQISNLVRGDDPNPSYADTSENGNGGGGGGGPSIPRLPSLPRLPGVPGLPDVAGKGAIKEVAQFALKRFLLWLLSVSWPILLALLILLLLLLLLLGIQGVANHETPGNNTTYTPVVCSDKLTATNLTGAVQAISDKFYVTLNMIGSPRYSQATKNTAFAQATQFYNTLCVLFGHFNGNTTDNTFGQLYKGTGQATSYKPGSVTEKFDLHYNDPLNLITYKDCDIQPLQLTNNNTQWTLPIDNSDKCDPTHLAFIIGRTLGRAVAERSKGYAGNNNVFNLFTAGPFTTEKYIPTTNCQTSKTPEDCFADMVGAYLIYLPSATAGATGNGKNIIWLDSGSSGEFGSHMYWRNGQCSQASLAEVLNAYGGRSATANYAGKVGNTGLYRIEEVELLSQGLGVWDDYFHSPPGGGSLQSSWQKEADFFGFTMTYQHYAPTLDNLSKVIDIANKGTPVIVTAPNHYLVIWGGDSTYVWTLDSSPHDFTWAPAYITDGVNIVKDSKGNPTPWHIYENNPTNHPVTKAEFLKGLGGFTNYWGAGPNGEYTGDAVAIILTPKKP